MQENNNFQTIINTWRRRSEEQAEQTFLSMSGDSPDKPYKAKEESELLVPDKPKVASVAVAAAGTVAVGDSTSDDQLPGLTPQSDEKQEFITRPDKEHTKEGAGDSCDKDDTDYMESKDNVTNKSETKWDKDKFGDKVDSVFLRAAPPHKTRSMASTSNENEDCGMTCLYYTMQCCDCSIM